MQFSVTLFALGFQKARTVLGNLKGEWVSPQDNSRLYVGPIVTWGELRLGRLSILPRIIWDEHGGSRMWIAWESGLRAPILNLPWTHLLCTRHESSGPIKKFRPEGSYVMAQLMINIWFLYITSKNRRGCWSLWNIILERHNKIFLLFF